MTWQDPIVDEVRKQREKLFAECGYDLYALAERLKTHEAANRERLVSLNPASISRPALVAEERAEYGTVDPEN